MTVTDALPTEQQRPQRLLSWAGWHVFELAGIAAAVLLGIAVWGPLAWSAVIPVGWLAVGPLLGRWRARDHATPRPDTSGRQFTDPSVWKR